MNPAKFADTVSSFNDAELRTSFYSAARAGFFAEVVRLMASNRWLGQHQAKGGWSVLHQAAYHRVGKGMLRRLRELGACEITAGGELHCHAGRPVRKLC